MYIGSLRHPAMSKRLTRRHRSARDDALERLRKLPRVASLQFRNPPRFYRHYRYLLLNSKNLEEIHDSLLRLQRKINQYQTQY